MKRIMGAVVVTCLVLARVASAEDAAKPAEAPKGDLEKLNIELPKPMFVGTPKDIKGNLDPAAKKGQLRGAFMVPKGTTNVALKKPVTSSDMAPIIGELELITDGDKDGSDGSFVELGFGVQHVQIDLKADYNIHAVVVWHYHSQARVYRDVVVQVSDDPDFIKGVTTVFNNDHDNTAGLGIGKDYEYIENFEGKLVDTKGVKGRYVRLYSNGNTSSDLNHYIEVEVYGTPAK